MGIGLVVLAVAGILYKAFPELYKRKLRDKLVVTSMAQVGRAERRGRTGGGGEKGKASSLETTQVSRAWWMSPGIRLVYRRHGEREGGGTH
jgi:hypothetical protein